MTKFLAFLLFAVAAAASPAFGADATPSALSAGSADISRFIDYSLRKPDSAYNAWNGILSPAVPQKRSLFAGMSENDLRHGIVTFHLTDRLTLGSSRDDFNRAVGFAYRVNDHMTIRAGRLNNNFTGEKTTGLSVTIPLP